MGLPERGLDANRGQSTSSEMGGQIGVQKLRIGAANPNAIMPMVKRLKDRLPNVEFSRTIEVREEILRQLIDFEIDVAAIGRPPT
ncbi:MAG: hypothetical protein VX930_04400, partial [Pseudomonadota bacterium]|nr:hypothetical protein [Pseudomonadota bacterium]